MKEQLYTIPVTEAFQKDCECPLCILHNNLEQNAIEFILGPSYMEDDIREQTNKLGFCNLHLHQLYNVQNRLGLSLIAKTHMDEVIHTLEHLSTQSKPPSNGLFHKKSVAPLVAYIHQLHSTCYACQRIEDTFHRYLITILYLYKTEPEFRNTLLDSKGFCTKHYGMLYEEAPNVLKGNCLGEFYDLLNEVYLTNMKRVRDDLDWFIDKFDYRYVNEPWKNSKDALPRSLNKLNGITVDTN